MDSERPAPSFGEYLKIPSRLSSLDRSKCVFLSRDREVVCIIASELQEDPTIGSAFVSLPAGMKEAWAKFQAGSNSFLVTVAAKRKGLSLPINVRVVVGRPE